MGSRGWTVPGAVLLAMLSAGFLTVPPVAAQFTPALQDVIASPCKLDVVLVTFQDATEATRKQSGWSFEYDEYDLATASSTASCGRGTTATSWTISSACSAPPARRRSSLRSRRR